jgi:hypothetical protein
MKNVHHPRQTRRDDLSIVSALRSSIVKPNISGINSDLKSNTLKSLINEAENHTENDTTFIKNVSSLYNRFGKTPFTGFPLLRFKGVDYIAILFSFLVSKFGVV